MAYEPTLEHLTSIDFKIELGGTTILFRDYTSQATLETYPANSITAVANGINIKIQFAGGGKTLVESLSISTIKIDGVAVTAVLVTALAEINALFANAGGGVAPTITSSATIQLTSGGTINYVPSGTNVVTWTYDSLPTGIVPVAGNYTLIGGSGLTNGTHTIVVRATNYHGTVTQNVIVTVSSALTNTLSLDGSSSCYATNNGTRGNTPFERPANGPGQPSWTVSLWFRLTASMISADPFLFKLGYPGSSWAGRVQLTLNAAGGYIQPKFHYGANSNRIAAAYTSSTVSSNLDWHHIAWSYNGGDTTATGCFEYYFDGVKVTSSTTETVGGTGYSAIIAEVSPAGPLELFKNNAYQDICRIDEFATWPTQLSDADITKVYGLGTPIDLNNSAYGSSINGYKNWYMMGDNGDVVSFPVLNDKNTATGTDLTITNGSVANYVSDTP